MTPHQTAFLKRLRRSDGESPSRTFERWAEMAYCALAKPAAPADVGAVLEARYQRHADAVGPAGVAVASELLSLVVLDLEASGGRDCLGGIAQHDDVRATNRHAGQFFTPFELSLLLARLTVGDVAQDLEGQPFVRIAEPASGAGGMILATVVVLREAGVDVTRQVWFDATDVASLCFHLSFIQMALVGCAGLVRQGDSLRMTTTETALLPLSPFFLARHGWPDAREPDDAGVAAVAAFEAALVPDPASAVVPPLAALPFALARPISGVRPVQIPLFGPEK